MIKADATFIGESNDRRASDRDDYISRRFLDSTISGIAGIGDVNGDGLDDFLISSVCNTDGGWDRSGDVYACGGGTGAATSGQTYLILGRTDGWGQNYSLSKADASFLGEGSLDLSGYTVGGAGDVNGDGLSDFLIASLTNSESNKNAGQVYLFLGKKNGWSLDTNLSHADASFLGENAHDNLGEFVGSAGDVNGDGLSDIIISSSDFEIGRKIDGKVYLFFGKEHGWKMRTPVSTADASFLGGDRGKGLGIGWDLASLGDVNGDGYGDIALGAGPYKYPWTVGRTYIILGEASDWKNNVPVDKAAKASIVGHFAEHRVSPAGDLDHDGYTDLIIIEGDTPTNSHLYIFFLGNGPRTTRTAVTYSNLMRFASPSPIAILLISSVLVILGFVLSLTEVGLFACYSLSFLLYTRMRAERVLDNFTRGCVYGQISANPGMSLGELSKDLHIPKATVTYHVKTLEREGLVRSYRSGTRRVFIPSSMNIPKCYLTLTKVQSMIYNIVKRNPGISLKTIRSETGLSRSAVSRNVNLLVNMELIKSPSGKIGRYFVYDSVELTALVRKERMASSSHPCEPL